MRKSIHSFVLVLIVSLLLCASYAMAEESAPKVKAVGLGAKYQGSGILLVYGRADDAATLQILDYLAGNAKQFAVAGTTVVVAFEDIDPSADDAFISRAKSRSWNKLNLVKADGSLPQNLSNIGQGGRVAYPSIFTINATGFIVDHAAGNLSVPQKENVIRNAFSISKNANIKMTPGAKKLNKGKTFTFKPSITPKVSAKYVKYESSDDSIVRVSQSGKVKAVSYGTATVTASFGENVASCDITVSGPLKSIKLNMSTITIDAGEKFDLEIATLEPFNAAVNKANATWKSGNKKVAVVENGIVTGISGGSTKITVKLSGKTTTCTVKVNAAPVEPGSSNESPLVSQVLTLINKERSKKGLSALKNDARLAEAANIRAKEIVEKFDHTRPNGMTCFSLIPYSASHGGENIAAGYETAEAVVQGWMNSEAHKKNLLKSEYRESGVGLYTFNGRNYWVQMFTRKK